MFDQNRMAKFFLKAKRLANSLGIKMNLDTCYTFYFSDSNHCCGGDGLKGFNPHNEWDLSKCNFNVLNLRYWSAILTHKGKLDYDTAFIQKPYDKFHKKFILWEWQYKASTTEIGYFKPHNLNKDITEIYYTFEPNESFQKLIAFSKNAEPLKDGETV